MEDVIAHQVHCVRQYKNHAYKVPVRYSECFEDEIITEFAQVRQVSHINLKDTHFYFPPPSMLVG